MLPCFPIIVMSKSIKFVLFELARVNITLFTLISYIKELSFSLLLIVRPISIIYVSSFENVSSLSFSLTILYFSFISCSWWISIFSFSSHFSFLKLSFICVIFIITILIKSSHLLILFPYSIKLVSILIKNLTNIIFFIFNELAYKINCKLYILHHIYLNKSHLNIISTLFL